MFLKAAIQKAQITLYVASNDLWVTSLSRSAPLVLDVFMPWSILHIMSKNKFFWTSCQSLIRLLYTNMVCNKSTYVHHKWGRKNLLFIVLCSHMSIEEIGTIKRCVLETRKEKLYSHSVLLGRLSGISVNFSILYRLCSQSFACTLIKQHFFETECTFWFTCGASPPRNQWGPLTRWPSANTASQRGGTPLLSPLPHPVCSVL
jgi:hypothetical protein